MAIDGKRKQTGRERFLSEREAVLPAVQIRAYLATNQSADGKNDKGPAKAPCQWL